MYNVNTDPETKNKKSVFYILTSQGLVTDDPRSAWRESQDDSHLQLGDIYQGPAASRYPPLSPLVKEIVWWCSWSVKPAGASGEDIRRWSVVTFQREVCTRPTPHQYISLHTTKVCLADKIKPWKFLHWKVKFLVSPLGWTPWVRRDNSGWPQHHKKCKEKPATIQTWQMVQLVNSYLKQVLSPLGSHTFKERKLNERFWLEIF